MWFIRLQGKFFNFIFQHISFLTLFVLFEWDVYRLNNQVNTNGFYPNHAEQILSIQFIATEVNDEDADEYDEIEYCYADPFTSDFRIMQAGPR